MKKNPLHLNDRQRERGWTARLHVRVNALYAGHWLVGHIQASRVCVDHELMCFLGGETEVIIGDQVYRCRGGEALILPPAVQQFSRAVTAPIDRICIHFDWDRSRPPGLAPPWVFHRDGEPDPRRIKPTPSWVGVPLPLHVRFPDSAFRARALELPQIIESDDSPVGMARLEAVLSDLLLRLIHAPSAEAPVAHEPDDVAARAKLAIETRYAEAFSLAGLAHELGIGASQLSRRFRSRFGVTAVGYLQEQRLQAAHELLIAGGRSIAAVAQAVGIPDPNYFARVFAKRWGHPPSAVANGTPT